MSLRPFDWYCSAWFDILFVSILCTCCSHLSWYCFISFTMFCVPVFGRIHWFFSLSSFVIPSKCLKNFRMTLKMDLSDINFDKVRWMKLHNKYYVKLRTKEIVICHLRVLWLKCHEVSSQEIAECLKLLRSIAEVRGIWDENSVALRPSLNSVLHWTTFRTRFNVILEA